MTKALNKTWIYLLLIILLGGALRVARMFEETRYSNDAYLYFQMAEDWAAYGSRYVALYDDSSIPPLLPWLMAKGYCLGLDAESTGLILGILLGTLMPLAVFWAAFTLFSGMNHLDDSPKVEFYALLAALLVATHPFLARISVSCLREILYLPFIFFAFAFAISAVYNKSLWKWCAFALLAALANLTRREGILLVVIFLIWLMLELAADRKDFVKNIKHYILSTVAVIIIFLVINWGAVCIWGTDYQAWSPFGIKYLHELF